MRKILWLFLILGGALFAQENQDLDPQAALDEAQKRLDSLADPKSNQYEEWREAITRRIYILKDMIRTDAERKTLLDPTAIAEQKKQAESALEEQKKVGAIESVKLNKPDELAEYETTFREAEKKNSETLARLDQLRSRSEGIPAEIERLADLEAKAKLLLEQIGQDDKLALYRTETARMTLSMVENRRSYLRDAQKRLVDLIPVRHLEADLAALKLERGKAAFKLAGEEAARLRGSEADRLAEKAEAEQKAAEKETDRIERFRKEMAAETTLLLSETDGIRIKIDALKLEINEREQNLERIRKEKQHLEKRMKIRSEGAAQLLKTTQDRALRGKQYHGLVIMPELLDEMNVCESELVHLLDLQWSLQLIEQENVRLQALLNDVPLERHEEAKRVFAETVGGADGLLSAIRAKKTALENLDSQLGQLSALAVEIGTELDVLILFLRSRLFWVQSALPMSMSNFVDAGQEFLKIGRVYKEQESLSKLAIAFRTNPWRILGLLLAVGLIILAYLVPAKLRRRFMREGSQQTTSDWRTALYRSFLALLSAGLPAAAYLLAAYLVRKMHLEMEIQGVVPTFLVFLALFTFIRRLGSRFLAAEGVATQYLGMPRNLAAQLVRSINLLAIGGIFFYAPAAVLAGDPFLLEHIPRILHVFWLVMAAISLILLIRRRSPLVDQCTRSLVTLRKGWVLISPLLSLALIAVVVLDACGFHEASKSIMINALQTFAAILLFTGFYGLMSMIIAKVAAIVKKRRVKAGGAEETWASSEEVMHQLKRLFAFVCSLAALLVILKCWEANLLLSDYLENIRLFEVRSQEWLSLYDVVIALLWIAGGHFVVQNLTGVYENFVFPLIGQTDKGGRFVLLALSRYAILVIAYSVALLNLEFSFSSLGWLLAAISVGLGFGLQEIVANFVSGLILLIERPIRVGDIITVGDTGGTVEKIMIRATVVTNWDRQSIVIPNKNFITQNLTNWTHNDEIMRRVIKLRVAYGTDVEKLLKILDEVITGHPCVLSDPPHRVWFDSFGQTSLEFIVWFFATISDGLRTRTELYKEIYQRLETEGIEIPLPQQVLRMSSESEKQSFAGVLEKRNIEGTDRGR